MKKIIVSIIILNVLILVSCIKNVQQESFVDSIFGVRGNCEMCKTTIEKSVISIDGVVKADWNIENKSIEIRYNSNKTHLHEIHTAIINSGYDTEVLKASDEKYQKLPSCCKYDRTMKMNISGKTENDLDK